MMKYILFGYRHSHWTKVVREKLTAVGISFELETNVGRVHPDGTHPLGLTTMPTLRRHNAMNIPMAEGLEQIEEWLEQRQKDA